MGKGAKLVVAGVVALGAAQLVPVRRTNPPVEADVVAPAEVKEILRRSCYDCHSNETVWGWHTRIAPISWLVAYDVGEGREHLNFSRWGEVQGRRLARIRKELPEEVGEGEMPPWRYLLAHPAARLSDRDRALLAAWGRSLAP